MCSSTILTRHRDNLIFHFKIILAKYSRFRAEIVNDISMNDKLFYIWVILRVRGPEKAMN